MCGLYLCWLEFVVDDTLDSSLPLVWTFSYDQDAHKPVVPTTADLVWLTDSEVKSASNPDGYNFRLSGDSFKKFVLQHATTGTVFRGGSGRRLNSMYDYNIQGVAGITCRFCRDRDDDRRLGEVDFFLEEAMVQTEEFKKWEETFCAAIISKGAFEGASGCRIAVSNCEEGSAAVANDEVHSYLVKDMRAAPQEGIVFVLESGN